MTDSKPQPNKLKTIVVLSDGETWDLAESCRSTIVLSDCETWDYAENCKYFEVPASWDGDAIEEFVNNQRRGFPE